MKSTEINRVSTGSTEDEVVLTTEGEEVDAVITTTTLDGHETTFSDVSDDNSVVALTATNELTGCSNHTTNGDGVTASIALNARGEAKTGDSDEVSTAFALDGAVFANGITQVQSVAAATVDSGVEVDEDGALRTHTGDGD